MTLLVLCSLQGNNHLLYQQIFVSRACSHHQTKYSITHQSKTVVLQVLLERATGATKDAEAKQQNLQVKHAYVQLFFQFSSDMPCAFFACDMCCYAHAHRST